jgi:hypothetical protein
MYSSKITNTGPRCRNGRLLGEVEGGFEAGSPQEYGWLDRDEAEREIANLRRKAELLIPDMMDTYDLIYTSRFKRLVEQFIVEREAQSRNSDD